MIGWKIYFAIIGLLLITGLMAALGTTFIPGVADSTTQYNLSDWLGFLILGVILFGVYSYISKKPILSPQTWKVFGSVMILFLGWMIVQSLMNTPGNQWLGKLVIPLPAAYVFYKLGWSSSK